MTPFVHSSSGSRSDAMIIEPSSYNRRVDIPGIYTFTGTLTATRLSPSRSAAETAGEAGEGEEESCRLPGRPAPSGSIQLDVQFVPARRDHDLQTRVFGIPIFGGNGRPVLRCVKVGAVAARPGAKTAQAHIQQPK